MIIKNCTLETSTRYEDDKDDKYNRTATEILNISIPLPGGKAYYTIDLPKDMKANLEFASQLSEKK